MRDALAERAKARGQSLQAFLLSVVQDETRRARNASLLARFAGRADGSRMTAGEVADVITEARAERDERRVPKRG